ncbi:tripartite tricarboxylate transporter substrate-binding protein [Variovorax sp. OV329]|uniref:tripartite tricarboxylate transporter substrate-binding protein n=1 Tax=Variovorax sp. OV329 TaxID=1882825 RepID=UPI0020C9101B|nr:tripartite tricarboxylate transporter substrate-binding protein [Variovorax sp. OV329]
MSRLAARCASLVLAIAAACAASAQSPYPQKPIRLIVPFAAGGSTDLVARVIAEPMAKALGQPVVVDNRAGAGGMVGTEAISLAEPDGYTLGMATGSTMAANPAFFTRAAKANQQLRPLVKLVNVPAVISVHPSMQVRDFTGFVAELKRRPGAYNYPTPGAGGLGDLTVGMMNEKLGVSLVPVPYRGMGPALVDALAGTQLILGDQLPSVLQHLRSGKLLPIAIGGDKRSPELPQVPTFAELGYPDLSDILDTWFGLVVPAKTPPAVVEKIRTAALKAVQEPAVQARMRELGASIAIADEPAFVQMIGSQLQRNRALVQRLGLKVE